MKYILLLITFYSTIAQAGNIYIKPEINSSGDKGIAAGYSFNNIYRADLMYSVLTVNSKDYASHTEIDEDSSTLGTKRTKYKTHIKYILLNNYFNILNKEDYSLFASVGIGYARMKEKVTELFSGVLTNGEVISVPLTVDKDQNRKNKVIYSFGAGASLKASKNINIDISYNYRDFGKVKAKHYKVHQAGIGVRFNI